MTRSLAPLILWTVSLAIPSPAVATEVAFERHEVVTGWAERQTVVPGFFLDGDLADLAVIDIGEGDVRRLQIYAFGDGRWERRIEVTLPPAVSLVDVADIGGRDRLITHADGRLGWFDPESRTQRSLVEVADVFHARPDGLSYSGAEPSGPVDAGEVPRVDISRDLNGDGRDDLIFPDVDGFTIFLQAADGSFADGMRLGPPEPFRDRRAFDDSRTYGRVGITPLTVPWYLSRVHQMDYDRDGLVDLVFWNEDHFDVHLQAADGSFSPVAETFTTDVPFDSDGVYSLVFGFSDETRFSLMFGLKDRRARTVLHSFRDMNGDGVADLVTRSLEGRSLMRQGSVYAVYPGGAVPGGTAFTADRSARTRYRGRAPLGYASHWLEDFDGDDRIDVLFGRVETGLGGMIRAMLGTTITISCELHQLEDADFADEPSARHRMKSDIDTRGGRDAGYWPASLVGDVNGDGLSDVLVGKDRGELYIFLGGEDMLVQPPQRVAVELPGDERNSWLVDLDRDGKQDLLMHHPSTTAPHRVTMLIAQ